MTQISDSSLPIGVFDSGLGGLTILRRLAEHFPNENFVYLGDTARLPYGTKSATTIRRYLEQTTEYLLKLPCKAIVVACNSASTALIQNPPILPRPIYNVISPGARMAARSTNNQKIGIIGTRATVKGRAYVSELSKLKPSLEIYQQACPLFVPLVEEGWHEDPITNLIAYRYLKPLVDTGIDTLILACTHYPILTDAIRKVTGPSLSFVDSALALAEILERDLQDHVFLPNTSREPGSIEIQVTDPIDHFQEIALKILSPISTGQFRQIDL